MFDDGEDMFGEEDSPGVDIFNKPKAAPKQVHSGITSRLFLLYPVFTSFQQSFIELGRYGRRRTISACYILYFFLKNDAPVSKTKNPSALFDGEEEDLFSSSKVRSQQLYI